MGATPRSDERIVRICKTAGDILQGVCFSGQSKLNPSCSNLPGTRDNGLQKILLFFQQIPDFHKQCLILRRRCRFFFFTRHHDARKIDHKNLQSRRHSQKVDNFSTKQPIGNFLDVNHPLPYPIAPLARHDNTDHRHQNVLDAGIND